MSHNHPTIEYAHAFDAMLFKAKAGLTARQLAEKLGSKEDTIWLHLHVVRLEGLVYVLDHTPTGAQIFAWQPHGVACEMPDHVRVASRRKPKRVCDWPRVHAVGV